MVFFALVHKIIPNAEVSSLRDARALYDSAVIDSRHGHAPLAGIHSKEVRS